MQKINDDNLITGYIKQLLHSFNLPKAKVISVSAPAAIYENGYYIKDNKLMVGKKVGNNVILELIDSYQYNRPYLNITKNLELKNSLYDSYTHKYLGDYLRFMRDYNKVDLMQMYNCFAGEYARELDISIFNDADEIISKFDTEDTNFAYYLVPVKFNKVYTIAVDSSFPIEVVTCFYSNGRISFTNSSKVDDWNKILKKLYNKTHQIIGFSSFNEPVVYSKLSNILDEFGESVKDLFNSQESNLTLVVKLPVQNKSSFVVLEGDYSCAAQYSLNLQGSGKYLGRTTNWYKLDVTEDSTPKFTKVLDIDTAYYYDAELTNLVSQTVDFEVGETYYFKDETIEGGVNSVTLSDSCGYYNSLDKKQYVSYYTNNYGVVILPYRDKSLFPQKTNKYGDKYIYVDESTGKSYNRYLDDETHQLVDVLINSNGDEKPGYSRKYNSKSQLLFINDGNSYAFADRLIGYLFDLVITNNDNIEDNIRRLQKYYVENEDGFYYPKQFGYWDSYLRDATYDLEYKNELLSKTFDSNGYVDKDIEKIMGETVNHDTKLHVISGGVK